jgi:hypothetical protein
MEDNHPNTLRTFHLKLAAMAERHGRTTLMASFIKLESMRQPAIISRQRSILSHQLREQLTLGSLLIWTKIQWSTKEDRVLEVQEEDLISPSSQSEIINIRFRKIYIE